MWFVFLKLHVLNIPQSNMSDTDEIGWNMEGLSPKVCNYFKWNGYIIGFFNVKTKPNAHILFPNSVHLTGIPSICSALLWLCSFIHVIKEGRGLQCFRPGVFLECKHLFIYLFIYLNKIKEGRGKVRVERCTVRVQTKWAFLVFLIIHMLTANFFL